MPPAPIPNAWRAVIHGHSTGSQLQWEITPAIYDTSTHDESRRDDLLTAVANWADVTFQAMLDDTNTIDEVRIEDLAATLVPTGVATVSLNGTVGGNPAGAQVAAIVTLTTGLSGRSYRGRLFYPGVSSTFINDVDGTLLDPAAQVTYHDGTVALDTTLAALGTPANLGVVSRTLGSIRQVTGFAARSYLGTQRRRTRTP